MNKSDIYALLDGLPDEFSARDFLSAFEDLEDGAIPQWRVDRAFETHEKMRREGGRTIEEVEARIESCLESLG